MTVTTVIPGFSGCLRTILQRIHESASRLICAEINLEDQMTDVSGEYTTNYRSLLRYPVSTDDHEFVALSFFYVLLTSYFYYHLSNHRSGLFAAM